MSPIGHADGHGISTAKAWNSTAPKEEGRRQEAARAVHYARRGEAAAYRDGNE